MTTGIYRITNTKNNKFYIGSSVCVENRRNKHYHSLEHNKHENSHLQRAWNKYGKENFKYEIVEEVHDKNKLLEKEQMWLDSSNCCDRSVGYNICEKASSRIGVKISDKQKNHLSKMWSGEKGLRAVLRWSQVREMRKTYLNGGVSMKDLDKKFGVSEGCVQNIITGTTWKDDNYDLVEHKNIARKNSSKSGAKNKGRKASLKTRRKISERTSGINNPRYGAKCSKETILKMKKAKEKKYLGEKNPNRKLTEEQVREIRKRYIEGNYTLTSMASDYKVSLSCISFIINRRSWKHI